jgi:indole-3-glycerol phosphate synthase
MANILDEIVTRKREEVAALRLHVPEWERQIHSLPPARDFAAALRVLGEVRVIAEVKKASPSAGVLRSDFDPVAIASTYEANGAACLSVLTDAKYFQGSIEYLKQIREAMSLPLLRKEFIIDVSQIVEARAAGADAVLLIAEILPGTMLNELHTAACELGLQVLIELHDAHELQRVLDVKPALVGINNRDLRTFETRLSHTLELMKEIPPGVAVVSESGISTHAELLRLQDAGVCAVLVGESLMRSADIGAALRRLRGVERHDL